MSYTDQITLRQLKALKAVAEHRTIVAAADVLNLTGPAVHNQLKKLEEAIESDVFDREAKGTGTLTPQGQAMLRAYDEIQSTLARAFAEIEALRAGTRGSLTLGVVSTAKYFAPAIVARLAKELPDVQVSLKVGNREEVIESLRHGEFDLCIMGRPPRDPLVEAESIGPHPHVIIAPPDHPLAGRRHLRPRELAAERFVLREHGSGTRILTERFLAEVGGDDTIATTEMTSNETIKQAVIHGLGIALISAHTVAFELEVGRLVPLDVVGLPIQRTWYVISPVNLRKTLIAEKVSDWLVRNADSYLPQVGL
ncbi:LysR substrate-binding domain-containing protein [Pseudoprimorskyibacter insulae]|uniref:HTH-type transcriptional regulator CbbR n=1 Tax=Pseudoprimorskyibacter insulae TaxID=1695997 RepID=A0A2R8ATW4_9RHOB|nr:LysR substrate-binding domain-containing protein [Pseudoprimorskyibacter insulae]SPF79486.1 HTH-type transcriptional activator CmpR [Pseudoprimorskyibacter insulae]